MSYACFDADGDVRFKPAAMLTPDSMINIDFVIRPVDKSEDRLRFADARPKTVLVRYPDGTQSAVVPFSDVVVEWTPATSGEPKWARDDLPRQCGKGVAHTISIGVRTSVMDAVYKKLFATFVIPAKRVVVGERIWFAVEAPRRLAFTAAVPGGKRFEGADVEDFMQTAKSSILGDVGVGMSLAPMEDEPGLFQLEMRLINVHVRDHTPLSSPRTIHRVDNVDTGGHASPELEPMLAAYAAQVPSLSDMLSCAFRRSCAGEKH
ncbi:uncharacterized protein PFL1_05298 [Pseudozyma flocculosa PF-1]|uniref:Uncharacterized protein n=2 Tax=Pseudozyma flocculosa TaxID=84751 RepID=A0A5C3FCM1_9BASI|nr:uncharacterized protein PFL1_05298 [Pseudozyma flocculosa PF-1]EPQ27014.1 hypothetical protein PFL1_05298 [Pseudozyma flocculosa PF-1]SPO42010.1 uncharacterized protein PSFLO_07493 [Pseudozyma flocculosa]